MSASSVKDADITVAYRVELPELFILTSAEYEAMHSTWAKAVKVLPNYSIVHKQDFFIEENYTPDICKDDLSFLSRSFERMLNDPYFSPEELSAIALGYTKLLEESVHLLNDLKTVVNENGLSMEDKDRMDIIDKCYTEMLHYRSLVQYYTNKNISVSYLRAKKQNDLDRVMALYGSPNERYW